MNDPYSVNTSVDGLSSDTPDASRWKLTAALVVAGASTLGIMATMLPPLLSPPDPEAFPTALMACNFLFVLLAFVAGLPLTLMAQRELTDQRHKRLATGAFVWCVLIPFFDLVMFVMLTQRMIGQLPIAPDVPAP